MNKKIIIIVSLFLSADLFARDWLKLTIPGAYCGNGKPYEVFYKKEDNKKLAINFGGGGACWSTYTCYGPNLRTWIHRMSSNEPKVYSLRDDQLPSPLLKHTQLFFPYCTGDIFASSHIAKYQLRAKVHHTGYSNIKKSLAFLSNNKIISLDKVKDLVVYGSSAGGIASFIHTKTIEKFTPNARKKVLIVDSPGLHFGDEVWSKFSKKQFADFVKAMKPIGIRLNRSRGMVSDQLDRICSRLYDWKVGILQSTEDWVMTTIFGDISPDEHRRRIRSQQGLYRMSQKTHNCAAWVIDSRNHILLSSSKEATKFKVQDVSAFDFAVNVYKGDTTKSYISDSIWID